MIYPKLILILLSINLFINCQQIAINTPQQPFNFPESTITITSDITDLLTLRDEFDLYIIGTLLTSLQEKQITIEGTEIKDGIQQLMDLEENHTAQTYQIIPKDAIKSACSRHVRNCTLKFQAQKKQNVSNQTQFQLQAITLKKMGYYQTNLFFGPIQLNNQHSPDTFNIQQGNNAHSTYSTFHYNFYSFSNSTMFLSFQKQWWHNNVQEEKIYVKVSLKEFPTIKDEDEQSITHGLPNIPYCIQEDKPCKYYMTVKSYNKDFVYRNNFIINSVFKSQTEYNFTDNKQLFTLSNYQNQFVKIIYFKDIQELYKRGAQIKFQNLVETPYFQDKYQVQAFQIKEELFGQRFEPVQNDFIKTDGDFQILEPSDLLIYIYQDFNYNITTEPYSYKKLSYSSYYNHFKMTGEQNIKYAFAKLENQNKYKGYIKNVGHNIIDEQVYKQLFKIDYLITDSKDNLIITKENRPVVYEPFLNNQWQFELDPGYLDGEVTVLMRFYYQNESKIDPNFNFTLRFEQHQKVVYNNDLIVGKQHKISLNKNEYSFYRTFIGTQKTTRVQVQNLNGAHVDCEVNDKDIISSQYRLSREVNSPYPFVIDMYYIHKDSYKKLCGEYAKECLLQCKIVDRTHKQNPYPQHIAVVQTEKDQRAWSEYTISGPLLVQENQQEIRQKSDAFQSFSPPFDHHHYVVKLPYGGKKILQFTCDNFQPCNMNANSKLVTKESDYKYYPSVNTDEDKLEKNSMEIFLNCPDYEKGCTYVVNLYVKIGFPRGGTVYSNIRDLENIPQLYQNNQNKPQILQSNIMFNEVQFLKMVDSTNFEGIIGYFDKVKKVSLYYENPLTNNYHYYGEFKSKDVFMGIGKSVLKYVFAIYPEYDNSYNYYGQGDDYIFSLQQNSYTKIYYNQTSQLQLTNNNTNNDSSIQYYQYSFGYYQIHQENVTSLELSFQFDQISSRQNLEDGEIEISIRTSNPRLDYAVQFPTPSDKSYNMFKVANYTQIQDSGDQQQGYIWKIDEKTYSNISLKKTNYLSFKIWYKKQAIGNEEISIKMSVKEIIDNPEDQNQQQQNLQIQY